MNSFDINKDKLKSVHFIGIGGISMSALAEVLLSDGVKVSGSDSKESKMVKKLESDGAIIYIGHKEENIGDNLDLVVYTDAISDDNPEYLRAKRDNIPLIDRGNFLGQLMTQYETSIAIAGTHGKTTTTSMLSAIIHASHLDPTILLGGELDCIGGNVRLGDDKVILTEACEYKGNILKFYATLGVVLNVEADHLDYYNNIEEIIETFKGFVEKIPASGYALVNSDDQNALKALGGQTCTVKTFGIENESDYRGSNITFNEAGVSFFDLTVDGREKFKVILNVTGLHNIYNAIAALATAHIAGIDMSEAVEKLTEYNGTHRRLEHKGFFRDIRVIDDYAHHPTEIKVTLKAIKNLNMKKVWCIFQPHTYTRTKSLLEEFSESFSDAGKVIITDIFAAREKDNGEIHSTDLVDKLVSNGVDAIYIKEFADIKDFIEKNASKGDLVLTMGAGDVYTIGESLVE